MIKNVIFRVSIMNAKCILTLVSFVPGTCVGGPGRGGGSA